MSRLSDMLRTCNPCYKGADFIAFYDPYEPVTEPLLVFEVETRKKAVQLPPVWSVKELLDILAYDDEEDWRLF